MTALKELLAQRDALEAEIAKVQSDERNQAVAKVKALMSDYGLTIEDLSTRALKAPKAKTSSVAPKYVNKGTGETWSGRGLQPKWLKAAIAVGASLDNFKV